MSLSIAVKDASFSKIIATTIPQQAGLVYANVLGGTQAKSERNLVIDSESAPMVGSPTINANSIEGSYLNAFNTGLLPTAEVTFIALIKKKQSLTGVAHAITNFSQSTNEHDTLCQASSGALRMYGGFGAANQLASISTSPISDGAWYLAAGVITASAVDAKFVSAGAVSTISTAGTGRLHNSSRAYSIGGQMAGPVSNGPQSQETAAAFIWNRALSNADILEVYNWLKARYAGTLTIV